MRIKSVPVRRPSLLPGNGHQESPPFAFNLTAIGYAMLFLLLMLATLHSGAALVAPEQRP